jgi:hypothetical protein
VADGYGPPGPDAPPLASTVVDVALWRLALLSDRPAPGTAFLAVEGDGEQIGVSVWSHLCGPEAGASGERDEPCWRQWLTNLALAS